jgi:hypothetical protein
VSGLTKQSTINNQRSKRRVPVRLFLISGLITLAMLPVGKAEAVFGGHSTTDYKCVGMIGSYDGTSFLQSGCGVAIGRDWVLSVAHVDGNTYIQDGRRFSIQQRYIAGNDVDLALFKLTEPIKYKATLLLAPYKDLKGKVVQLVGYGNDAKKRSDGLGWQPIGGTAGKLRVANNVIDDLRAPNSLAQQALMYDLDPPKASSPNSLGGKAIRGEGGVAGHDSGGGWFITVDKQPRLVAISDSVSTAIGSDMPTPYCYGGLGYGIYLAPYRGWINRVTGLNL